MNSDKEIFDLIAEETVRQKEGVELIASENYVSNDVMQAMGSVLTNKYAEGLPFKRYYGGCEVVDEIEDIARERAKALFNAEWVNVSTTFWCTSKCSRNVRCVECWRQNSWL